VPSIDATRIGFGETVVSAAPSPLRSMTWISSLAVLDSVAGSAGEMEWV
jgi:hypothetical protein